MYFYSNSTIEVSDAKGERYGMERLLKVISSSGNDASKIVKSIRQDMTEFTESAAPKADIAIAVLKYTPTAAEV